jgi:hypothetical protein
VEKLANGGVAAQGRNGVRDGGSVVAGRNGALGKFPYMGSLTSHEFYEVGTTFQNIRSVGEV